MGAVRINVKSGISGKWVFPVAEYPLNLGKFVKKHIFEILLIFCHLKHIRIL